MSCIKGCLKGILWIFLLTFAIIVASIPIFFIVEGESGTTELFILCLFAFSITFVIFEKILVATFRLITFAPDVDEIKSENRLTFIILYIVLVVGTSYAISNEVTDSTLLQLIHISAIFIGAVLVWYSFVMALDDTASTAWRGYLTFIAKYLPIYILFRLFITLISFVVFSIASNNNLMLDKTYLLFTGENVFGSGFFDNFILSLSTAATSILLYDLSCDFYKEYREPEEYNVPFGLRVKKVFFEGDGLRVLIISIICIILKIMKLIGAEEVIVGLIVTLTIGTIWLIFFTIFAIKTKLVYFIFSLSLLYYVERAVPLPNTNNLILYISLSIARILVFSLAAYFLATATIVGEEYHDYAKSYGVETKLDSLADLSIAGTIDKVLSNDK